MRGLRSLALVVVLLVPCSAVADARATVQRFEDLIVMTPTPTQDQAPGLRMRDMRRPIDKLWIGPAIPFFVPPAQGDLRLALLDRTASGGWVATYREIFRTWVGTDRTPGVLVKLFDSSGAERFSVQLDPSFSRRDRLEVQDVRFVEAGQGGALYFNEACQSYSREAGGHCSALVAVDPFAKRALWRTGPLVSNNEFLVRGDYIVTAYGFTAEPASIRVVRRSDGAVVDRHALAHTNFEMTVRDDVLSVEMWSTYGTAHFRMEGFDGATAKLASLPTTPPDPNWHAKPWDPPPMNDTSRALGPGQRPPF